MQKNITSNILQKLMIILLIGINLHTYRYTDLITQNLSDMGNKLQHPLHLLLWASSAAIYFYIYTRKLMKYTHYNNAIGLFALRIFCMGMIASVCIPYAPESFPNLAKWHIRIAMISTIGYVIVYFHYLFDLMYKNYYIYLFGIQIYGLIVVFDAILYFLIGGVTTLLETSFVIAMSICLYLMRIKLENTYDH